MRLRGARPRVAERAEPGLAVGDRGKGIEEIPRRAVEPRHYQHVAGVELVKRLAQLARSVLAPLAVSRNTFLHPALVSWRTCASTL